MKNNEEISKIILGSYAWTYFYYIVIESYLMIDEEIRAGNIYNLYLMPISRKLWLIIHMISVSLFFYISSIVTFGGLKVFLGIEIMSVKQFIIVNIMLLICGFCASILIFSIHLVVDRMFHIINLCMDIVYVMIGVLYPLTFLNQTYVFFSQFLPLTQVIRVIRGNFDVELVIMFLVGSLAQIVVAIVLMKISEKKVRKNGIFF